MTDVSSRRQSIADRPKLAVCIGAYEYGGQGTFIEAELSFFRERYPTTLIAERIDRPVPSGVNAIEMPAWGLLGRRNKALVELLTHFDLVHCSDSLGLMRAAIQSDTPVVVTSHGIAPPRIRGNLTAALRGALTLLLYPRLYRSADIVIAISSYIGDWVREFASIEPRVILLGAEAPARLNSLDRPSNRNALYVGEVSPRKGISDLLRGIAAGPPDVTLEIVGRGDVGRYAQEARTLGIRDRVSFRGTLPEADLRARYRAAHCTVTASLWEGFGLPIMEGFRFGRPCVARAQGGMQELIDLSGAGRTFEDPLELGACVDDVTRCWDEMARRALAFAAAHTWEKTFQAYALTFETVLERSEGRLITA